MAQPGGILDISSEQFDPVLKTNLFARVQQSRRAAYDAGSTIINTSLIQAYQPSSALLDCATTKA